MAIEHARYSHRVSTRLLYGGRVDIVIQDRPDGILLRAANEPGQTLFLSNQDVGSMLVNESIIIDQRQDSL